MTSRLDTVLILCSSVGFATGCASVEERPRTEDDARQLAPLPACIGVERGGASSRGDVARSLREEQIWTLVYPDADAKKGAIGPDTAACNGRRPLELDAFRGGNIAAREEGRILLGAGSDRLKVAWLRSIDYPDGTSGGALALLRSLPAATEVYAVGAHRGGPRTLLAIERIGAEIVVTAQDDGCTGRKGGAPCETIVTVYRPRLGVLERVAAVGLERVRYATGSEPGVLGRIEYRLTSAVQYLDGGIRVVEQVMARDEQQHEVRKAELERAYTFAPDGSMVVDEDSLWSRFGAAPK
jgi:hypothetical protein